MVINVSYTIPIEDLSNVTLDELFAEPIRGIQKNTLLSGGALNMETEGGHLNLPIIDIAARLYKMKETLGGYGGDADLIENLNSLMGTGLYKYHSSARGNPLDGQDGRIVHIETSNGQASQLAFAGTNNFYVRDRDVGGQGWGSWREIVHSGMTSNIGWLDAGKVDGKNLSEIKQEIIAQITDDAPGALNTLNELAAALGDDKNFAATILGRISGYGEGAPSKGNLNTIDKSGFYRFAKSATGNSNASYDGRLLHIQSPNGEASQLAFLGAGTFMLRDKDQSSGDWGDWQNILIGKAITSSQYWSTDNASDSWLVGENFKGDTSVGLEGLSGRCYRIGDTAMISLSMRFVGFSKPANDDASIAVRFKLDKIAQAAGWFNQVESTNIGNAYGMLIGDGWDSPWIQIYCEANTHNATYPNALYLSVGDTNNVPAQSSNATEFNVKAFVTVRVSD